MLFNLLDACVNHATAIGAFTNGARFNMGFVVVDFVRLRQVYWSYMKHASLHANIVCIVYDDVFADNRLG